MSGIRPGIVARTRFWRSKTAGEGAALSWCGRLVHVGARIPFAALPAKHQRDDATWYRLTFLDGPPPPTENTCGDPPLPLWPWPAKGLAPLTPEKVADSA